MQQRAFGASRVSVRSELQSIEPAGTSVDRSPNGRLRRLVLLLAPVFCLVGCVERRMTIRTNVDQVGGALAMVDHQEVGYTPLSTGFTYYADREIRLIKDGYETLTVVQPIPAPWWDIFPLDFFVENLWPFTLRDEREFRFDLQPPAAVTGDELLGRAGQLRNEGHRGAQSVPPGRSTTPRSRTGF